MISGLLQIEGAKPGLTPDIIGYFLGMPISNVWMMTWFIGIFAIILLIVVNKRLALVPGTLQSYVEVLVEGVGSLIMMVSGSERAVKKLLPVIGPLFTFILLSNVIGVIPGLGAITYDGVSLLRTVTSDYNMTLTLGILVSLFVNGSTALQIGFFSFIGKFIQIKNIFTAIPKGFMAVFEACIGAFVGLMDIVGEIAKVLSMTLRLFGNIYAGEVMTVVFYGLSALLVPSAWLVLSTFSGIIQALVFTMLTIVFYSLSVDISEAKE